MNICEYDGREFEAGRSTAKYCSGACKMKAKRLAPGERTPYQKGQTPPPSSVGAKESHPNPREVGGIVLTKADLDYQAGYMAQVEGHVLNFSDRLYNRTCNMCGTKYDTHLPLFKQCSYKCYNEILSHLTTSNR